MSELPAIQSIEKYGYSITLHDFGQTKFETYQMETLKAARQAFFQFSDDGQGVTAQARVRGETVRVALRLKIISGIELSDLEDMKPYVVEWIAEEIKKHVTNVATAPSDPN
jgi:hypothetical protein